MIFHFFSHFSHLLVVPCLFSCCMSLHSRFCQVSEVVLFSLPHSAQTMLSSETFGILICILSVSTLVRSSSGCGEDCLFCIPSVWCPHPPHATAQTPSSLLWWRETHTQSSAESLLLSLSLCACIHTEHTTHTHTHCSRHSHPLLNAPY